MLTAASAIRKTRTATALWICASAGVQAQQPPETGATLPGVVITATKKPQDLQDVAASVTVVTGDDLARSGLVSSFDLQQKVPGLNLAPAGRETNVAIRGVSNNVRSLGADPSVAVSLDGVYLPRSSMALTELFDLTRVEVLKGPEGTLYGRNATGGAINLITRNPSKELNAEGFVGAGSLALRRTQLAAGGGNDAVSGRVAVAYTKDHGYTKNLSNDSNLDANDFSAFRGKLRFALNRDADLTVLLQSSNDKGTVGYGESTDPSIVGPLYPYAPGDPGYQLTAADERNDPRHVRLNSPVSSLRKTDILAATVNWYFDGMALKSITGATKYDAGDAIDADWTGQQLETQVSTTYVKSYSQEFQLYSTGEGPFDWTGGLFFYKDDGTETLNWNGYGPLNCAPLPAPQTCSFANQRTDSTSKAAAAFGQVRYKVTDVWSALIGARYNRDLKSMTATNLSKASVFDNEVAYNSFTPKAQLQWTPSRLLMAYAGVSKGFKSGGLNFDASGVNTFKPESLIAYEAGVRSTLLDSRLILNASVFFYDYKDLQLRTAILQPNGKTLVNVNNASRARVSGLEVSGESILGGGFSTGFAGTYVKSELLDYISPTSKADLSGMRLPLSPKLSGTVYLDHQLSLLSGSVKSHVELNGRSGVIFPLTLDQVHNSGEGFGLVNASVRWSAPKDRYYVQLGVLNATDKLYRTQREDYLFGGVVDGFGAPRTFEMRLGFKF